MTQLTFRVLEPPMDTDGHSHSHGHILLPLTKELSLTYKGVHYHVTAGDVCFVPPRCFHHCYCPTEVVTMNVPSHMISTSDLSVLESRIVFPVGEELQPLIQLIKSEVRRGPDSSSLCYLFYFLYCKLIEDNESPSLRYIREHYNQNVSIEMLAQRENYTPAYFTEWFKQKTGYTPTVYLRRFRVEKAKELMLNGQYSLLDIALQVGYNSHSSFTRAFKETTGCTPQEYRSEMVRQD